MGYAKTRPHFGAMKIRSDGLFDGKITDRRSSQARHHRSRIQLFPNIPTQRANISSTGAFNLELQNRKVICEYTNLQNFDFTRFQFYFFATPSKTVARLPLIFKAE